MFSIILYNELKTSSQNLNKIIASFLFFIIFIFIANLLQQNSQYPINDNIIFWLALSCVAIFSSYDFLKSEYENGMLEQMIIACYNFEIFIFAKIICNWINYCLPIIIATYLINRNIDFIATAIIATFIINVICCFCGSFSLLGNSSPLIAIIALPLIIPTIILSQNSSLVWQILLPLGFFCFFLLSFLIAKIAKIILE